MIVENKENLLEAKYSNEVKLCKDCEHFIEKDEQCRYWINVDYINGKNKFVDCSNARLFSSACGKSATHFKAKK